jgi:hypothetical protein
MNCAAAVEDRLVSLRSIYPGATLVVDGGREYILLPDLKITTDGKVVVMDALLRPGEQSGYPTRLFLAQALPTKGRGGGWSAHVICARTWHTWSWRDVPADLPVLQILLGHLWALR